MDAINRLFSENPFLLLAVPALLAFVLAWWAHPRMMGLAIRKNIVDRPGGRKLQSAPVPVLGGAAVFLGILPGMACLFPFFGCARLSLYSALLACMLCTGTLDDIRGLSPWSRLLVEILAVLLLFAAGGHAVNDFHGLWGVGRIPWPASMGLTVFAAVGIINSINLIDGVNGLSSGYCIMACAVFAAYFRGAGDMGMAAFALVCAGALVPFFLHNVFGQASRMFIGDGGTLVMGMALSIFVTGILGAGSCHGRLAGGEAALVPFTLSVLSMPVFDTLRVMACRMARKRSPFRADKTHLHHLFIEVGFSHPGTAFCVIALNALVVLAWWLLYKAGCAAEAQLYAVAGLGLLFTSGTFFGVKALPRKSRAYRFLRRLAAMSHVERKGAYAWLRRAVDKA